jgi:DNA-binding CsgD family transcriptional regulator
VRGVPTQPAGAIYYCIVDRTRGEAMSVPGPTTDSAPCHLPPGPIAPRARDGMVTGGTGLVRAAEWHRVREFAVGIGARREPGLLTIAGEAGAGKSTLCRAGMAAAAQAGCRVLRSEPSAADAEAPFAGLADLLSGVLPEVADSIPGPQREALEVALLLRSAGDAPPTAHAVSLAVLAALRSCLEAGPVLMAVDDVQWLDAGSMEALVFAVRRIAAGPLGVLLAPRTEAPADPLTAGAPPLPDSWRDLSAAVPGAGRIDLAPLDQWQIQDLLPPGVTAAQVRLAATQSRGNPFWALQVAASLAAAEAPVPELALTLTRRLARSLSQPAADALAVVAAAGRIAVPDAVTALGRLTGDPAAALDAAVLAGVVVETGGRVAAAHPLIGAAAVESLPPARRLDVYRRLAETATSPEGHAHFAALAAGPGPDPDVAEALEAAAEAAHARAANVAAGQFAARATTFTPQSDAVALTCRRIRAGELLFQAGDIGGSAEQLEALDTARLETPDLERALPLLTDAVEILRGPAAAMALVAREVEGAGPDPRRRALLLALASDTIYGIRGQRRAAAVEAIACAEAAGPGAAPAMHRALLNLMMAKVTGGEGLDTGLLERAERLEESLPPIPLYDTAGRHRGLWSRAVEDLDTSQAALRRLIARAKDAGEDLSLVIFLSHLAETLELSGDFEAAGAAVAEARQVDAFYDWPVSPWRVLKPHCELMIAAGNLDEALRLADELRPDDDDSQTPSARFVGAALRGKISAWRGDTTAAIGHFELAAWCADQCDWFDPGWRERVDTGLSEAYVSVGRPQDAAPIAARLREIGTRLNRPALVGDAARIDALAAAAVGDLDGAAASAREAVGAHERSPLKFELARSLLVLGRIERRRKARRQARAALQRAWTLAEQMGHRPLQAHLRQELPRISPARAGDQLTGAEQRVADQIATGATSQEAAAALFISVRTVETHVASIYRKLGLRTRSELRRTLSARPNHE